ncbi:MAG: GNAT family N-acetyltransferase [Alphaproteobacteria bacterium]|nr:GNAT family N-acetyltransferase [Alphaproteobacteria bacterium]
MSGSTLQVRPYSAADEGATIELWQRSWQKAYPDIDFAERVAWWRERWRNELVPQVRILVAEMDDELEGFVTVDPKTGYLDQIVVAPEFWGSNVATLLLDAGKRVSPARLELLVNKDNARAISFYEKNGFEMAGDDVNPVSGRPVFRMRWRS